jgi:hypothetical protein
VLSGVVAETKMVGAFGALPLSLQDAPIMQLFQATMSHYAIIVCQTDARGLPLQI